MTTGTLSRTITAGPDYAAIKQRQQATWAAGDYAVIGTTLQIVGERICEAVDLRAGERVLDVAAGNGNGTLAAARRFARVTSTDYVGALLERGAERAAAERLPVWLASLERLGAPRSVTRGRRQMVRWCRECGVNNASPGIAPGLKFP